MRTITQYSERIYATKSSAMRAVTNAIGRTYAVEDPNVNRRFGAGEITVSSAMVDVNACEGGWRWSYTYNLADVMVEVRDEDGTRRKARYADVRNWIDAVTPPAPSKPDQATPTETDTPAPPASPVVGKIHPNGHLFLHIHVGAATGGEYSFELAFDSGSCAPLILCEDTGKTYELPWRDILTLAVAAGVTKADAPKSSGRETA